MRNDTLNQANRRLATLMLLVVAAMFGFGFALVPLYDLFCDITGLNGKTAVSSAAALRTREDTGRLVTVELLANPGEAGGWDFRPTRTHMRVHPGRAYGTAFLARNPSNRPQVVRAVPSVAPGAAARHLLKTECFCFTRQRFAPAEEREMPLRFTVDPALPEEIGTLSLAYTLYLVDAYLVDAGADTVR